MMGIAPRAVQLQVMQEAVSESTVLPAMMTQTYWVLCVLQGPPALPDTPSHCSHRAL